MMAGSDSQGSLRVEWDLMGVGPDSSYPNTLPRTPGGWLPCPGPVSLQEMPNKVPILTISEWTV